MMQKTRSEKLGTAILGLTLMTIGFWASAATADEANLLVVYGRLYQPDGHTLVNDGDVVVITNQVNDRIAYAVIGETETGKFEGIFLDPPNTVAGVGDMLRITVIDAPPEVFWMHELTALDIQEMRVELVLQSSVVDGGGSTWGAVKSLYR